MEALDEIVKEFLVESYENLDRLDQDFVRLEKSPADRETLGNLFRVLHTLKSSAGMFGFQRLEKLGHAGEHLLGRLRDVRLALNSAMVTALLADADTIRGILRQLETSPTETAGDDRALIETLHLLADGKPAPVPPAQSVPPASPNPPPLPSPVPKSLPAAPASATAAVAPAARGDVPEVDELTREFVLETQENLAQLVRHLSQLEDAPGDHALISAVFRTLHTLRGNSSFFGFTKLERIARAAEDLLERLRSGALTLTLEMTEVLHDMVEVVRELLAAIQSTGRETERDYRDLIACLAQLTGVTVASPGRAPNPGAWPGPPAATNPAAGSQRQSPVEDFQAPTAAERPATAAVPDLPAQLGDFPPPALQPPAAAAAPPPGEPRAPDLAESTVRVDLACSIR